MLATGWAKEKDDWARFPELAPERCATLPPDQVFESLPANHPDGMSRSMRGEDYCYDAYQRQLQKYVDAHYPRAKKYRRELQMAYKSLIDFLWIVWQPENIGHAPVRSGAWAEWAICRGERANFDQDGGSSAIELEKFCLELAERFQHRNLAENDMLPPLHDAIRHLMNATSDNLTRWYFAGELQSYAARYDKPEKKEAAEKK